MKIEKLLSWSEPKEVETKKGPAILRKSSPTKSFWDVWNTSKDELKSKGISVSKYSGNWEVCWWSENIDAKEEREKSVESSKKSSSDFQVPCPKGLSYMPFQLAGIEYAFNHEKVLIADEMGLGKTIQAVGLINYLKSQRVLVVCPASLKINWKREMEKWLVEDRSIEIQNGVWKETDICIINYEILSKHLEKIQKIKWDVLIGDESHYLKNYKAKRTKNFFSIKADRKVLLTGTPILNRPKELFSTLKDFKVYFVKNYFKFAERYCGGYQDRFGYYDRGATNTEELGRKLRETCMVRRIKSEVLSELPDKVRQIVELPTNGSSSQVNKEKKAYQDYNEKTKEIRKRLSILKKENRQDSEEYRDAVREMKDRLVDFTEISKLRHETALSKVEIASDMVAEAVNSSGSVIVFGHHKDVLQGIYSRLREKEISCTVLTGDTPIEKRQQYVDDFQEGKTQVFLGSIMACGTGLTLTKSSHEIFVELEWTPSVMEQAEDRAHRIGQKNSVLVQYLVFDGSIDSMLAKKLVEKEEIIESIMESE